MCFAHDTHHHRRLNRRSLLQFGAAAVGGLVVGCGGEESITPPASGSPAAATSVATPAATTAGSAAGGTASARTLSAAQAFIGGLDATQKASVLADRTQPNLSLWSNLPDQLFKRSGLRMDKLSADQQKGVLNVLSAALSPEGYAQATQVTTADGVLAASGGQNLDFGADHYWVRFVGAPSASSPWTIQYGGHHLAINLTVSGSKMTMAPTLWGSQPAFYEQDGRKFEPLSGETNKAFALMTKLDGTQQAAATLPSRVSEIVLGAGKDGQSIAPLALTPQPSTTSRSRCCLTS